MKTFYLLIALAVMSTSLGCATHRAFVPLIEENYRAGLVVDPPVAFALFDGRASKEQSKAIENSFRKGLEAAYGNSIKWVGSFSKAENGNVTIRIRIKKLGSDFGSRVVSSMTIAHALSQAEVQATGSWGTIVSNASVSQNLLGGSFATEGWWIGTAWLELDIEDRRTEKPVIFTLPMVAEHRESNMWGYRSATEATKRAWSTVMPNLMHTMDMILMKVRDDYELHT